MDSFRTADGRILAYRREGVGVGSTEPTGSGGAGFAGAGAEYGPVLVCHPGGPGYSSRYFEDLAGLEAQFTLVLVNPRGTEGSDRPDDPRAYRTEDYVSDLEELREHLGLERMLLLGHSHGGVVAAAYAAAYPERVEKLVLASTLARFGPEQEQAMKDGMETRSGEPWYGDAREALEREEAGDFADEEELRELAMREFPFYFAQYDEDGAEYLQRLGEERPNPDALRLFNTEILKTFDLRPDLERITAPTLVITGELDFITGPVCAADFAAIPGQRTVIVGDCGHFILFEARDRFRDEVAGFLSG